MDGLIFSVNSYCYIVSQPLLHLRGNCNINTVVTHCAFSCKLSRPQVSKPWGSPTRFRWVCSFCFSSQHTVYHIYTGAISVWSHAQRGKLKCVDVLDLMYTFPITLCNTVPWSDRNTSRCMNDTHLKFLLPLQRHVSLHLTFTFTSKLRW